MQPQPTVIVSQPYVIANGGSSLTVGVKSARGLGITQIIIGSLTILLGILTVALLNHWAAYVGFAIWGGIWVSLMLASVALEIECFSNFTRIRTLAKFRSL